MKRVLSILLLLVTAASAITLDELQQRLTSHPVLRCHFTQQRFINGLDRPLKSSGEILVAEKLGLFWRQQKPFAQTLLLTPDRMTQTLAGQPPHTVTAENNPQLFQFNSLLLAILNADRPALEKSFTLSLSETNNIWTLSLKPAAAPLDKIFKTITLSGTQHLEHIRIDDMQGDSTQIQFTHHNTTPSTLTPEERQLFHPAAPAQN